MKTNEVAVKERETSCLGIRQRITGSTLVPVKVVVVVSDVEGSAGSVVVLSRRSLQKKSFLPLHV